MGFDTTVFLHMVYSYNAIIANYELDVQDSQRAQNHLKTAKKLVLKLTSNREKHNKKRINHLNTTLNNFGNKVPIN